MYDDLSNISQTMLSYKNNLINIKKIYIDNFKTIGNDICKNGYQNHHHDKLLTITTDMFNYITNTTCIYLNNSNEDTIKNTKLRIDNK